MLLTKEELQFIEGIKKFVQEKVSPLAIELDEGKIPPTDLIKAIGQQGLFGVHYPVEYGGKGFSLLASQFAITELAKGSAGLSLMILVQWMAMETLIKFGNEKQKEMWLKKLITGEKIAAFTISEAGAGSDAAAMKAEASKVDEGYELNGSKYFSTNGAIADVFFLALKTNPEAGAKGISMFIVPADTEGMESGQLIDKIGCKSSTTTSVVLKKCIVSEDALLGEVDKGFAAAMYGLVYGRLGMCSMGLGIAQAAFEEAVKYANNRVAFGKPIAKLYAIQEMVSDMHVKIEALRALIIQISSSMDEGKNGALDTSIGKLFAAETVNEVTHKALQVLGGHGYTKYHPLERYVRDGRLMDIGVGASEVLKMVVGGSLLRMYKE